MGGLAQPDLSNLNDAALGVGTDADAVAGEIRSMKRSFERSFVMKVHNLGPLTYMSVQPHPNHHAWLTAFTPDQRRQLIAEDYNARTSAFGALVGGMLFGLSLLIGTVAIMLAQ